MTMPHSADMPRRTARAERTLDEILAGIWAQLGRGVADAQHGFHTPALATIRADGTPTVRSVVLRGCRAHERALWFHTDGRAPKCADISANPAVELLFYDRGQKTQIRASGTATLHAADDIARRAFDASRLFSRRCYLACDAPGRRRDAPGSGLPDWIEDRAPTAAEAESGFAVFRLCMVSVRGFDWVFLHHAGHRRARFVWDDANRRLRGSWVTP